MNKKVKILKGIVFIKLLFYLAFIVGDFYANSRFGFALAYFVLKIILLKNALFVITSILQLSNIKYIVRLVILDLVIVLLLILFASFINYPALFFDTILILINFIL